MKNLLSTLIILFLFGQQSIAQYLDSSFTPTFTKESFFSYVKKSGDKIVVAGNFDFINSIQSNGIAVLEEDGSLFKSLSLEELGSPSDINILSSTDSLILIINTRSRAKYLLNYHTDAIKELEMLGPIGKFNSKNEILSIAYDFTTNERLLIKYNLDGEEIPYFEIGKTTSFISELFPLANNAVIVTGSFSTYNDQPYIKMVKIKDDGSIDTSFNAGSAAGQIEQIVESPTGDLFIFTPTRNFNNKEFPGGIIKITPKGEIDTTFNNEVIESTFNLVSDIQIYPSGKLLLTGSSKSLNNSRNTIIRLNEDGTLDSSFSQLYTYNEIADITTDAYLEIAPNEDLLLFGNFLRIENTDVISFGKINSSDNSIVDNLQFKSTARVTSSGQQNDGNLIVAGNFLYANETKSPALARILVDGSIDSDFNLDPAVELKEVSQIRIQEDGKIFITGRMSVESIAENVIRLLPSGTLDVSFNLNDFSATLASSLCIDPLNRDVYVLYSTSSGTVLKYDAAGNKDEAFAASTAFPTNFRITGIFADVNSEVFVAGYTADEGSLTGGELHKINSDGDLIDGFVINNLPQGINDLVRISDTTLMHAGAFIVSHATTDPNPVYFINNSGEIVDQSTFNTRGNSESIGNQIIDIILNKDSTEAYLLGIFGLVNEVETGEIAHIFLNGAVDGKFKFPADRFVYTGLLNSDLETLTFFGDFTEIKEENRISAGSIFLNNYVPEIKAPTDNIVMVEDSARSFSLSDFQIEDLDDTQFDLIIFEGENYTLSNGNKITPSVNFNGPLSIAFQVKDTKDTSELFLLEITVSPVNDIPELLSVNTISISEDNSYTLREANFELADPDTELNEISFTVLEGANYTVANQTITPKENYFGSLSLQVTFTDGLDTTEIYQIPVEVTPVNDVPILLGQQTINIVEDSSYLLSIAVLELEDPDSELSAIAFTILEGLNYTIDSQTVIPQENYFGALSLQVRFNDGVDSSDVYQVSAEVLSVNDIPQLLGFNTISIIEDNTYNLSKDDFEIADPDTEIGQISFSVLEGLNYTVEEQEIIPALNYFGMLNLQVTFTDGLAISEVYQIQLEVTPINDAPALLGLTNDIAFGYNTSYELTVADLAIQDPDNSDGADFEIRLFDGENYTLEGTTITPTDGFIGDLIIGASVNDGALESNEVELKIEVSLLLSNKGALAFESTTLYPNPSSGQVNIKITDDYTGKLQLTVLDLQGKIVSSKRITKNRLNFTHSIDLAELDPGLYLVKIISDDKMTKTEIKVFITR
jgi:uncharacterized delta-60 repeat protein